MVVHGGVRPRVAPGAAAARGARAHLSAPGRARRARDGGRRDGGHRGRGGAPAAQAAGVPCLSRVHRRRAARDGGGHAHARPHGDVMERLTYLSPRTEVKASPIEGLGLFAKDAIARGEIVAVKGGYVLTRARWSDLQAELGPAEIQIADDLVIAPAGGDERAGAMLYKIGRAHG